MKEYKAKRSTVILTFGFLTVLTGLSLVGLFFAEPRWFFVVILFAKVSIPRETAELFRTLALNVKMAALPFDHAVFGGG